MSAELPVVQGVRFLPLVEAPDYAVGDDGSVWTPFNRGHRIFRGWKRLSLYRRPYGARYVVVCLRTPADRETVVCRYVHRLVLEAFVGPCPDGMQALHDDNDTANNRLTNLRWGTPLENTADKFRHGTFAATLNPDAVRAIRRRVAAGEAPDVVAPDFGVTPSTVQKVAARRSWRHVADEPSDSVRAAIEAGIL